MLASPVPIYLGCAGLIVGTLGLGAQHMLGGNSVSMTNTVEQPLFAQSVEEASLPASGWNSQGVGVAHYQPMVELLTTPARSPSATAEQPQTAQQPQQEPRAAPREVVRDLAQPQTRPSRRTRNQRNEPPANEAMASTEQSDPRAGRTQAQQDRPAQQDRQDRRDQSRGQDRQRNASQAETDRRDSGPRRFDRRNRDRDDTDVVDTRTRPDRRAREGERVVVREDVREPEPRIVRGPEQREGGFTPFRLFGIFDR